MASESNGLAPSSPAAFFDVDETVISAKSMFAFLRYWVEHQDGNDREYQRMVAHIHALTRSGAHRTEINRRYYRFFAGVSYAALLAAGQDWYREYRGSTGAFVDSTLSAMDWHRARGHLIVLVSGSFRACLEPLARDVPADRVLCTEPIVDGAGRLTGEVVQPMIGVNKAGAVAQAIYDLNLLARDCFCYGDHSSDLQMLLQVGHPRVVGDDPVLRGYARRHGWPVLSARPRPLLAVAS